MLYQYEFLFPLMITIGVVTMVAYLMWVAKKYQLPDKTIDRLIIILSISGAGMLFFATFFNGLFHYIENPSEGFRLQGITYLGGFIGGVIVFIPLFYFFVPWERKNMLLYINHIIVGIVLAHAFGRIGCFFAGCCHGGETNAWYGIVFPKGSIPSWAFKNGLEPVKVVPTQLIESFFCFGLFFVLHFLKKNQFAIYLMSYGLFRFLIEFAREDDRGAFIGKLSPSQTLSLLAIIAGIVLLVLPPLMQKRKNNPQKAN